MHFSAVLITFSALLGSALANPLPDDGVAGANLTKRATPISLIKSYAVGGANINNNRRYRWDCTPYKADYCQEFVNAMNSKECIHSSAHNWQAYELDGKFVFDVDEIVGISGPHMIRCGVNKVTNQGVFMKNNRLGYAVQLCDNLGKCVNTSG